MKTIRMAVAVVLSCISLAYTQTAQPSVEALNKQAAQILNQYHQSVIAVLEQEGITFDSNAQQKLIVALDLLLDTSSLDYLMHIGELLAKLMNVLEQEPALAEELASNIAQALLGVWAKLCAQSPEAAHIILELTNIVNEMLTENISHANESRAIKVGPQLATADKPMQTRSLKLTTAWPRIMAKMPATRGDFGIGAAASVVIPAAANMASDLANIASQQFTNLTTVVLIAAGVHEFKKTLQDPEEIDRQIAQEIFEQDMKQLTEDFETGLSALKESTKEYSRQIDRAEKLVKVVTKSKSKKGKGA